jgi:hypothetical protein
MKVVHVGRRPKTYLFETVVREIRNRNTEKQGTFPPTSLGLGLVVFECLGVVVYVFVYFLISVVRKR